MGEREEKSPGRRSRLLPVSSPSIGEEEVVEAVRKVARALSRPGGRS